MNDGRDGDEEGRHEGKVEGAQPTLKVAALVQERGHVAKEENIRGEGGQ